MCGKLSNCVVEYPHIVMACKNPIVIEVEEMEFSYTNVWSVYHVHDYYFSWYNHNVDWTNFGPWLLVHDKSKVTIIHMIMISLIIVGFIPLKQYAQEDDHRRYMVFIWCQWDTCSRGRLEGWSREILHLLPTMVIISIVRCMDLE